MTEAMALFAKVEPGPIALKTERYAWDGVVHKWVSAPPVWLGAQAHEQIYLKNWRQRLRTEERLEGQWLEQLQRDAEAEEEERLVVAQPTTVQLPMDDVVAA
ncbi:putative serine/threonine-protein kinase [Hordeum vulgare]|nr:putative serine/threonine-protein kinase [Hordeum vulgare]